MFISNIFKKDATYALVDCNSLIPIASKFQLASQQEDLVACLKKILDKKITIKNNVDILTPDFINYGRISLILEVQEQCNTYTKKS